MNNFVLSVLASVIGGIILLFFASTLSQKARWVLIGVLSRILDVDIDYVFRDKRNSEGDVRKEIEIARWLCFFAGRGNELQQDTFSSIFKKESSDRLCSVRILLPETVTTVAEYNWLNQREQELSVFDPAYGDGLLITQIESNVTFLKKHFKNQRIQLRRYNMPNIGRMVLTDRCLFYTPYHSDMHGRHSRVYKFRPNCEIYENMLRLFDQLWNQIKAETNGTITCLQN
ncbi:MAG TPA: hypothetical protein VK469_07770 [Candidatus Kapabacteria bacterium]|nr:hypothetical protein [Candidatus Kapabacteria bacterium]